MSQALLEWDSEFIWVLTWQNWLYVVIAVDLFGRCGVAQLASRAVTNDFVLGALVQARFACQPSDGEDLIHNFDRVTQYVSVRYT